MIISFPMDLMISVRFNNVDQSAYKHSHLTKTALLSIKNEVHLSLARGETTAVILLDQSAAFDIIDHCTLIKYLSSSFGVDVWF